MATNFQEILSKKASEIEKPKPLPVGTYLCSNPELPKFDNIGKNESPAAIFNFQVLAPGDDVDPEAVSAYGDVRGKTIRRTMYLTDKAEYRTKEELLNGFNIEEGDKSLGEIINETVNKQVYVTVKHVPSKDGTEMYIEVEKLAAA